MPEVKMTLTADEKNAIAKVRALDQEGANLATTFNKATQAIAATEAMLAKLGKGLSFHGKRPTSQIAADLMGRLDVGTAARIVSRQATELRRQQSQVGLRGEAERLLEQIRGNERRMRASTTSETRFTSRFGDDSAARGKAKKKLNTFIRENDLGDVDDPVVRHVGRLLQRKVAGINKIVSASLAAVGGDTEMLTLARAQGVDIGRPSAVQGFVAKRRFNMEIGAMEAQDAALRGTNEAAASAARAAQLQANRERIARVFAANEAAIRATAKRPEILAAARFQGYNVNAPEGIQAYRNERAARLQAARSGSREEAARMAGELRAADASAAQRQANRERIAGVFSSNDAAIRAAAKRPDVVGAARFYGYNANNPEGIRSYRNDRAQRLRSARASSRMESSRVDNEGLAEDAAEAQRQANRERIANVFRAREEDIERKNLRSNRLAEARRLRQQRSAAIRARVGQAVTGIAGAGVGAIYTAENLLGNYNQRMGVEYFGGLASIEPMFREVMGMQGNAPFQKQLRQTITSAAIANGQPVPATSQFYYDVFSSAGNLSAAKQQEIIKSTMMFQSVAGGEMPVLGKAMTTIQQLYGNKIGSVDRAASIIKQTIDYGKFSATGFAGLAPEALSTAAAYGIPFEEAAASLAVASTRSGRDENMFTGARYVFSLMGKAADEGLVTRGAGLIPNLRELKKASQNQLVGVFGREGFNVASNLRDMVDDVESFTNKLRGTTGNELGVMQRDLTRDPVNALSRLAASVDVAGQNVYQSLIQSGPDGLKLAADALMTNAALTGQKMMSPQFAAITDYTKNADLEARKPEYASRVLGPLRADLMKQNTPGSRQMLAALDLSQGKIRVGTKTESSSTIGGIGAASAMSRTVDTPIMSTGEDVQRYADLVKSEGLNDLTATEYGLITFARNRGDETEAQRLIKQYRERKPATPGVASASTGLIGPAVGYVMNQLKGGAMSALNALPASMREKIASGAQTLSSFLPSGSQVEDAYNRSVIAGEKTRLQTAYNQAKASGNVYGMDAASARLTAIRDREDELYKDDYYYSATDRRNLVAELNPAGTSGSTFNDAVSKFSDAIGQLVVVLQNGNGGGGRAPTTQASRTAAGYGTPATRTQGPRPTTQPVNP